MYLFENYARHDVTFVRGSAEFLYSDTGEEYLDFASGISVTNLGHANPYIVERLKAQADKLWHVSNLFKTDLGESLAERLVKASFKDGKIFFCNSGAEANEAAIKLALIYNNKMCHGAKPRILTMTSSFHGRTYATLSATGQAKVQHGFEPLAPFFTTVEFGRLGALKKELQKGDVAAIILELIQGESGVIEAPLEYIKELARLAREAKTLLIFDEVQTGFGRTGTLFAYEQWDERPDIVTMAKSIANGLPMGAVWAREETAALFTHGTHGSTFGGNFLATACAHAVLDILLEDGFLKRVAELGELFRSELKKGLGEHVLVRGRGLMVGVEFPFPSKDFVAAALKEKLVTLSGGASSARLYPPLTISNQNLKEGAERVIRTYKRLEEAWLEYPDR